MLKMSGRIYNAMMKFANGGKSAPQFANMFFDNGKIYTTDSCAMCRWTPADQYEVLIILLERRLSISFSPLV